MDLNTYSPGRPPLPETMDLMKRMVKAIQKEPGIKSAKLAKNLNIASLRCSVLAKRLAKQGAIRIDKADDRALTYTAIG